MSIFVETQKGGLCRKHSLNAFYGRNELSVAQYHEWECKFDNKYRVLGVPSCKDWDAVLANQENVVAYVLRNKSQLGSIYIPPTYVDQIVRSWGGKHLTDIIDPTINRVFAFTASHIWLMAKDVDGQWWCCDSLRGVPSHCDPNLVAKTNNIGFMVVLSNVGMVVAIRRLQHRLKLALCGNFKTVKSINMQVLQGLERKEGIERFEENMCMFFQYYGILYPMHKSIKCNAKFYFHFQQRASDFSNIMKFVPSLLHFICNCDPNRDYSRDI